MRSRKSEAMSHLTGAFCFKHGFIVQNTCFDDEGTRRFFFATNRVFCHKRRVGSQKGPMAHCSMMQEVPCTWSTCYNCCTWSTWCTWCTCCTWFTCAPGALAAPGPHAAPGPPVAPGPPMHLKHLLHSMLKPVAVSATYPFSHTWPQFFSDDAFLPQSHLSPLLLFRRASICSTYPSQSLRYHPACTYS